MSKPRPLLWLAATLLLGACDDRSPSPPPPAPAPAGATASARSAGSAAPLPANAVVAKITARKGGFEPAEVHLTQGRPGVLEFTRTEDVDCVNAVRMPWMKKAVDLPLNETVRIPVETKDDGVFHYACWMNMVYGKVVIDPSP